MSSPSSPPLKTKESDGSVSLQPTYTLNFDSSDFNITKTGTEATITTSGSAGTIAGTIADTQVAYGTAADTIGGDANFIWTSATGNLGIGTIGESDRAITLNNAVADTAYAGLEFQYNAATMGKIIQEATGNIYFDSNNDMIIRTNGSTEAMRILSSGNVGIGTSAAATPLHVVGASYFQTGNIDISQGAYAIRNASAGTNKISFPSTGVFAIEGVNVGVGTSAPEAKVHIESGSAGTISVPVTADELVLENSGSAGMSIYTPDANNATINFGSASDDDYFFMQGYYNSGAPFVRFSFEATETMRMNDAGELLIGDTVSIADCALRLGHATKGSIITNSYDVTDDGAEPQGIFFRGTDSGVFGPAGASSYNLSITTYDDGDGTPDTLSINAYGGIAFCVGSNTRNQVAIVHDNDNFGIGASITTPATQLDVGGAIRGQINVQSHSGDVTLAASSCRGDMHLFAAANVEIIIPDSGVVPGDHFYVSNETAHAGCGIVSPTNGKINGSAGATEYTFSGDLGHLICTEGSGDATEWVLR